MEDRKRMRQYLDFSRIASRSEYWGTLIISWLLAIVLSIVAIVIMIFDGIFVLLGGLIMLAGLFLLIWIMLAVTAARCRDSGINPWWTAATMLPYIGFVVMIVVGCLSTKTLEKRENTQ
jgi:uncharacterized membrane protein YhaH (DUF805 family)